VAETIDFVNHIDMDQNEIRNVSLEKLAADPAAIDLFEGRPWINTTEGVVKIYLGGVIKIIAYLSDVLDRGAFVGPHDASTGIPTTGSGAGGAIEAGDTWTISVAGTITGILGDDNLSVGDLLIATADGANSAAQFVGVQRNLDDSKLTYTDSQTVSLPANTDTTVTAVFSGRITSVEVYNQAGRKININTKRGTNPNQIILHPNRTLSNTTVELIGFAN